MEEREDKIDENTIFLSKTVNGIEVEDKLNFADVVSQRSATDRQGGFSEGKLLNSDEVINLTKVSKWAKITPHEKGSEISIEIVMKDLNDEVYNEINYVKSFLHYYEEEFDLSNGTGRVKFFIRNKDDLETALGARVVKKDIVGESEIKEDFDVELVPIVVPIIESNLSVIHIYYVCPHNQPKLLYGKFENNTTYVKKSDMKKMGVDFFVQSGSNIDKEYIAVKN